MIHDSRLTTHECDVLVVGGSLVGMSAGLLLAQRGVRVIVAEHHRGTAIHPRAAQISQRTMEILRSVGIEQIVRDRSGEQFVQDGAIMAVDTLAGRELAHFIANLNEGVRDVSPTERVFISQSLLEPLLRTRAEELGADLRFSTDVTGFAQDADGINATLRHRDTGDETQVRARYMIGADGAHSRVRQQLGIAMRGHGTFSRCVTIYFRADVTALLRGRNLSVIYVNNPVMRGFFRIEKPFDRGFLAVMALGDPNKPVTDVATGLTESKALELVRIALGDETVGVEIENIMPWDAEANVAERMRDGHVFLAGDSAHVMPPNGGFGGNTGVQDAHNLAWKLAMVLAGGGGPALLDTYERERRPVGVFTTEQAYARYVTRSAPYLGTAHIQPVAGDLDVELGYVYDSAAVIGAVPPAHEHPRESHGRPGTRAPHVWIEHAGKRISTLDLFGRGFVMITGPEGEAWRTAALAAASELGLEIEAHGMGRDLREISSPFASAFGISGHGASIVRPDGFVGWQSAGAAPGGTGALGLVQGVLRALVSHR
ncbi:MAG TPA: FAD-dependent monooxygenase [Vicinamibacterales bacterium]|jgi:2-polyprenyl-6-methoxyphenol hydroxylase-like FAD-dependent oxidoreductase|nr:FAD-dependent monooxygenase [Vicinamibacterales bacterium]